MGTRNFGLGSRDMAWAGKIALKTQSGLSFSGIATVSERWGQFCKGRKAKASRKWSPSPEKPSSVTERGWPTR